MNESDEQQSHSMIPKTERYTETLKQALTRQRQKVLTRMHTAEKATKERDCTQNDKCLWQRKKEQTTNASGKERKSKPQMLVSNEKLFP